MTTGRRHFGSVRKLPSGRFQARYLDATGRRHTAPATFASKGAAQRWLAAVETDLSRGDWCDPALGRITFAEWAADWQRTTVDLRPSTRARDAAYLRNLILPAFGELRIADIDHLAIREWVAELMASGRSPATVVKAFQILAKVMRSAVATGAIRSNPCTGVPLPRIEREEMRFLTPRQVEDLAQAMDTRYQALIWLGAYGGLRAGELFGLRAKRVDAQRQSVEIVDILVEVSGHHHIGPPKTRAGRRRVPVPGFVADHLAGHLAAGALAGNDLVFAAPEGGPVRLSTWRRRFWHPAVNRAGLAPLRLHDLRHTAVALWIAAGLTPVGIAKRAGHTSVVTVQDRYGHLLPGTEAAADEALDAMARTAASSTGGTVTPTGATRRRRPTKQSRPVGDRP